MQPTVSIIIPCFNARPWIRDTLQSVIAQRLDSLEVIVIDDGSTDESDQIIRSEFGFVNLIRTSNRGASRARNLGTSLARGAFIQYLDADDLLAPGKIRTQMDALERTKTDVAYGDWQQLVSSGTGFAMAEKIMRTIDGEPELALFGSFWCPPAAYLFRRAIVDRVGGWNEGLPVIQDARFALDCALHGASFIYCRGIMAFYRVHGKESLSRRSPQAFYRDVYTNAREIEKWWHEHGGITRSRRQALVSCLRYVARETCERDTPIFDAAVADIERLYPGYIPDGSVRFKIVSRLVGYRRAEQIGLIYRRLSKL